MDIPGFEEWEQNFDEEEWRKAHPEDAAMIDSMFAAPEGGYLGDIDIEMPKLNIDKEKYIEDIKKVAEADAKREVIDEVADQIEASVLSDNKEHDEL